MQDNDKTTTPEQPDTFEVVEAEHRTGCLLYTSPSPRD